MAETVERWGVIDIALQGPSDGNPFADVQLSAKFTQGNRSVEASGFYDGDGAYKVRFSPDVEGEWSYVTASNRDELAGKTGQITCVAPGDGNHGPVQVVNTFHFAYADGTPYKQVGTTCYVWNHQGDALEEQTLASLEDAPFNKIRFCVFPKSYDYNKNDPQFYAFPQAQPQGDAKYAFDLTRFDPAFWRHFEKRVSQLCELGIEADIIVFHPYDRWGFKQMARETNDFYLKYLIARIAPYRNVWWSMANEYDLMPWYPMADWDHYFETFQRLDPYNRMRGVHNCRQNAFYDHSKAWVTHCSVQSSDIHKVPQWREQYGKPVVIDECCYEGNNRHCWGNITGEEMTRRFWRATIGGGYCGHGETYVNPEEILWWSKGGELVGTSPARIAFLRKILEDAPAAGLAPAGRRPVAACEGCASTGDAYFLAYFGVHQPASLTINLPEGKSYRIDQVDTWEMKIETLKESASGKFELAFAGKPYMALRIVAV